MEHQATAHQEEHPPTTIRQYVIIGLVLAVITLVELWLSYSGLPHGVMIAGLIILSAIKFAIVAAMFMHLRFDSKLFTRMFIFGFALAATLLIALISLFEFDHGPSRTVTAAQPPAASDGHGGAADGEGGEDAEGDGGEATGAADTVQGEPVADFFAANCAVCHGQNREGLVGPALTPESLTEADEFYFETIRDGRPGTAMPSWAAAGLTDSDINALVTFITTVEP